MKKGDIANFIPLCIKSGHQSKNKNIQDVIDILEIADSTTTYLDCVKSLFSYLEESIEYEDRAFVIGFLIFLVFSLDNSHPAKKMIMRRLNSVDSAIITENTTKNVLIVLNDVAKVGFGPDSFEPITFSNNVLLCCLEEFKPGLITVKENVPFILKYVCESFSQLIERLRFREIPFTESVHRIFYNSIKIILMLMGRHELRSVPIILNEFAEKVVSGCYFIITEERFGFPNKVMAALLMVKLFTLLSQDDSGNVKIEGMPLFDLLMFDGREPTSDLLKKFGINSVEKTEQLFVFKLCTYAGVFHGESHILALNELIENQPVKLYLFKKIIAMTAVPCRITNETSELCRLLTVMTESLMKLPVAESDNMFKRSLNYVLLHLDTCADSLAITVKSLFVSLIKFVLQQTDVGIFRNLEILMDHITLLPEDHSTRYIALEVLCSELGCSFLLKSIPGLAYSMLINIKDFSSSPQICNCYEMMMTRYAQENKTEEEFIHHWVKDIIPFLKVCEPSLTSFYQRLMISAFKLQPVSLKVFPKYSGDSFLSTEREILTLLGCLRHARKTSLALPIEKIYECEIDQSQWWRNLMDYESLNILALHQDDEIRVSVLALIVESHKTTEVFTEWEYDFIHRFFKYNMGNPRPSIRQQILTLIKKVFNRTEESYASFIRNAKPTGKKADPSDEKRIQNPTKKTKIMVDLQNNFRAKYCATLDGTKLNLDQTEIKEGIETASEMPNCRVLTDYYKGFLVNMFQEMCDLGLSVDANYPRKSITLEILTSYTCSKKLYRIMNKKCADSLLAIIQTDTFEANKAMAVALLKKFPPELLNLHDDEVLQVHMMRYLHMVSSCKPQVNIGAAYMLELYVELPTVANALKQIQGRQKNYEIQDALLSVCEVLFNYLDDLITNCTDFESLTAYGFFFCLRHLLKNVVWSQKTERSKWKNFLEKVIGCGFMISQRASKVVGAASPEGYLPENFELSETSVAQKLLIYAWRSVKEISLLFGDLALKLPIINEKNPHGFLSDIVLIEMGEYFYNLMLTIKHRGAFEQAHLGYLKLCTRLWSRTHGSKLHSLPQTWLKRIFDSLEGNEDIKACATRRSAGLPFLVQALLVSERDKNSSSCFHKYMQILQNIMNTPDTTQNLLEVQKVHALNILRALFRHTALGELVTPYTASGLMETVRLFGSTSWAIRNSATLMFSALITRVFGVQRTRHDEEMSSKNKMTGRVFFGRYPELYEFLLEILRAGANHNYYPSLYPALIILARLYPSHLEEDSQYQVKLYLPYVEKCLSNSVYRTRELAAAATVPLIPKETISTYIMNIFQQLRNLKLSNNHCHGLLLQLKQLMNHAPKHKLYLNVPNVIRSTKWILIGTGKVMSHINGVLYMEVIIELSKRCKIYTEEDTSFAELIALANWHLTRKRTLHLISTAHKKFELYLHYLKLHLLSNILNYDLEGRTNVVQGEILRGISDCDKFVKKFYLNIVHYLNITEYKLHPLLITEEVEYSDLEHKLVFSLNEQFKTSILKAISATVVPLLVPFLEPLKSEKDVDFCVSVLSVLHYYPNVFNFLDVTVNITHEESVLKYLLSWCGSAHEDVVCAILNCVNCYLKQLDKNSLRMLNYDVLVNTLSICAAPNCSVSLRLTSCILLLNNNNLFFNPLHEYDDDGIYKIWGAVMTLLEDEDSLVRNTVCRLASETFTAGYEHFSFRPQGQPYIPEYAREVLMQTCLASLQSKQAINLLLSWSFREKPEVDDGDYVSEVFERSHENPMVEVLPLASLAMTHLYNILWKLGEGLSFEDKSIFLEEQALLVATTLYNAFRLNTVPFISSSVLKYLENIFAQIIQFLRTVDINKKNFKPQFIKLIEKIFGTRHQVITFELSERVAMFIDKIFEPCL